MREATRFWTASHELQFEMEVRAQQRPANEPAPTWQTAYDYSLYSQRKRGTGDAP